MPFYWCKFEDYTVGTIEAPDEEAVRSIARGSDKPIQHIYGTLPYPASPVVFQSSGFPPFCYTPHDCVGHGSCRKNRACDD